MTQASKRVRHPAFWSDREVREAATQLHREMTLDEARRSLKERFGRARCPSRSALGRYWKVLDRHVAARAIMDDIVIDERLGFALIGLVGMAVTDGWTMERFREAVDAAAQNRADQLSRHIQFVAEVRAQMRADIFGATAVTDPSREE
jgi:hypothetical protein